MAQGFEFTEEEIRRKLGELGYSNIPSDKLKLFQRDLRQLIESERTNSRERGHLGSQDSPSSVSNSYYTDSYLEGSKDETTSSSNVLDSSKEQHHVHDRYRSPLEDSVFPRAKSAPSFSKVSHQPFGKENVHYYPAKAPVRVESSSTAKSSPQSEQSRPSSRNIKRKVLRRRDGESRVFDESFASTESVTDISELEQRLRDLPLNNSSEMDDADVISVESAGSTEPTDYRPWENFADRALPSFIRPSTRHPHTRQLKKSDPVSRYHQFKYEWQANKAPGEKSHKNLRWNVRGKMLQCDVFEKPPRNFVPNKYVVPTEKKRQALRWEVRSSLARV
ncbi:hypothetical protein ACROYT_G039773 [Oculina patagonica]